MHPIDPELHALLQDRAATNEVESFRDAARLGAPFGLLPIYLDWMGFLGLRSDGVMGFVGWEPPHDPDFAVPTYLQRVGLVAAAEHYPELSDLVPQRAAEAMTCPSCRGLGRPTIEGLEIPQNVRCFCGGLGWIIPGEAEQISRP